MAYAIKIKENEALQEKINDILSKEIPDDEAELLFDVFDLLEKSYGNEEICEITDAQQIEILTKYELLQDIQGGEETEVQEEVIEEAGGQEEVSEEEEVPGGVETFDVDFDKDVTEQFELSVLDTIENLLSEGDEASLREAVVEAEKWAQDPGEYKKRADVLLEKAIKIEKERFDSLKQDIDVALNADEKDMAQAHHLYDRLKTLRPGAKNTLEEIYSRMTFVEEDANVQDELKLAKNMLQVTDDYGSLLRGLDRGRILEKDGNADAELLNLMEKAEAKRREISATLGFAQTMGAMEQHQEAADEYSKMLDERIFEVDDPDNQGKKLQVSELLQNALDSLREAQKNTIVSRVSSATDELNTDPKLSLAYLQELDVFLNVFQGSDEYLEVTKIKVEATAKLEDWEKAQDFIEGAFGMSDPRQRRAEYEKAKNAFPGHKRVGELIGTAEEDIRLDIQIKTLNAIRGSEREIDLSRSKIPFEKIDGVLKNVGEQLNELGMPMGVLVEVKEELERIYTLFGEVKQRHEAIGIVAKQIEEELDKGTTAVEKLKSMLETLPKEDQGHILLSSARTRIVALGSDRDKLNEAVLARDQQNYLVMYKAAEGIDTNGDLAKNREELLIEARFRLRLQELHKYYEGLDYNKAKPLAEALLSEAKDLSKEVKDLAALVAEIKNVFDIITSYEKETGLFAKEFSALRRKYRLDAVARLEAMEALSETYKERPDLARAILKTREDIRVQQISVIRNFEKTTTTELDLKAASKMRDAALILENYDLVGEDEDAAISELMSWALETYKDVEIEFFSSIGNYDEVIETLEAEYGKEPPLYIRQQLQDAKRDKAMHAAAQCLNPLDANPEEALRILDEAAKDNAQLNKDMEVILLQSSAYLFAENVNLARIKLNEAEFTGGDKTHLEQMKQVIEAISGVNGIDRALEQAKIFNEDRRFVQLNAVLVKLEEKFQQLLKEIDYEVARRYINYRDAEYKQMRSEWLVDSVSHLQKQLEDPDTGVAEKVQIVFDIERINPENILIANELKVLESHIPSALARLLTKVDDFDKKDVPQKAFRDSIENANRYKKQLAAFAEVKKHLTKVISNEDVKEISKRQAALEKTGVDLDDMRDLLQPYYDYKKILSDGDALPDENICGKYERGQDKDKAISAILNDDTFLVFEESLNQDVEEFDGWRRKVDADRKIILDETEKLQKAFVERVGSKEMNLDRQIANAKLQYTEILKAANVIYGLAAPRTGDVYAVGDILKLWDDKFDAFSGLDVQELADHKTYAEQRKSNLTNYEQWYQALGQIDIDIPAPEGLEAVDVVSDDLAGMNFNADKRGVKQFASLLEEKLKAIDEAQEQISSPSAEPLDFTARHVNVLCAVLEAEVLKTREELGAAIGENEKALAEYKNRKQDTAKKLGFKKSPLGNIKQNLIKLYELNPADTSNTALLANYRKKRAKSKGGGFFGLGKK